MLAESSTARTALITAWLRRLEVTLDLDVSHPWWIRFGNAVIAIDVIEDQDRVYARSAALISTQTKASLELLNRILELNNLVLMGAFRLLNDGTLAFSCTQPLVEAGFEEFQQTLKYVAHIAERYENELVALGGGTPCRDLLET